MRRSQGLEVPETLAELAHPARATLLVYDMQVGICRQVADAPRVIASIRQLVDVARSCGMRIAYTRHLSLPKRWLGATSTRTAMRWQRRTEPEQIATPFARGAGATAIVSDLEPNPDDLIVDKIAMSAFADTFLASAMRDCALSTVILCGIATEVGIDPTVRHAADLGFVPVLVDDACGAGNAEAANRAVTALEFAGDVVRATTAELIEALRQEKA